MEKSNLQSLFILISIFILASCSKEIVKEEITQKEKSIPTEYICDSDKDYIKIKQYNEEHLSMAKEAAIYAMFANNAYKPTSRPHFNLPKEWKKVSVFNKGISGLYYEVYERSENNLLTEVVIAFRGTENKWDWMTGNIFGGQYNVVDKHLPSALEKYKDKSISIVVTGHSLGGGLALHASMAFEGITKAYGFDPSPRVHVKMDNRLPNYRVIIWEDGEVLEKVRKPLVSWLGDNKAATRYKYDFVEKGEHFSYPLARGLLALGATIEPELATLLGQNCNLIKSSK